jgi:hypothetical protein
MKRAFADVPLALGTPTGQRVAALEVVADSFDDDRHGERSRRHPKHRQIKRHRAFWLPREAITLGGQLSVAARLVLEQFAYEGIILRLASSLALYASARAPQ